MPGSSLNFTVRPAQASEAKAIRGLIHQVQINPTGLDWHRFLVAVPHSGNLIGCGQLKPHRDGTLELASIAVFPQWRRQGVASLLIHRLINLHHERNGMTPLYLTCRSSLGGFYARFGFQQVPEADMPPYFQRIHRLANLFMRMDPGGGSLLVMRRVNSLGPDQDIGQALE